MGASKFIGKNYSHHLYTSDGSK